MLFRSFLSDCWILQTTTAAPVGASIDRSAVSRLNNDGAQVAGDSKAGGHRTAFGEICADSVAHARHRNGVRRSVLCDTVMGTGTVFMERWLWAVGTGMTEGTECHVGWMVKWRVKLWRQHFLKRASEKVTPTLLDCNRLKTDVD